MDKRSHKDDHGMWGLAATVNDTVDTLAFYLREGYPRNEAEEMTGGGLLKGLFRDTILSAAKRRAAKPRRFALCACSQHEHKCTVCVGGCSEPAPQEMKPMHGEKAKFCRPCGESASNAGWKHMTAVMEEVQQSTDCQMTLADHAEAWHREIGESVPDRDTTEWQEMYQEWIEFAFKGIGDG